MKRSESLNNTHFGVIWFGRGAVLGVLGSREGVVGVAVLSLGIWFRSLVWVSGWKVWFG